MQMNLSRVVYRDEADFRRRLASMKKGGASELQCVTDFDFTLTKFSEEGMTTAPLERLFSCHKVLEECNLLGDDYHLHARALQAKYYPLEVNPAIQKEEKTKLMLDWVTQAHELLLQSGVVSRSVIRRATERAVNSRKMRLREGTLKLLTLFDKCGVPTLLFSAGIADIIEEVLLIELKGATLSNLHIVSNRCLFAPRSNDDDEEKLVGFEEPLLHVFNKRAAAFPSSKYFSHPDLHRRSHLLLLGDSLGDLSMAEGLNYDANTCLRIGFLNDRPERIDEYLAAYDAVVLGDPADMHFVLNLVSDIVGAGEESNGDPSM